MDKPFLISTIPRVYYDHVILARLPEVSRFDIVHIGYLIHGHIFKYSYRSLKYEPIHSVRKPVTIMCFLWTNHIFFLL